MKGNKMKEVVILVFLVALALLMIGIGPLITLWSINTVFGMNIAYNLATWFGTVWLGMCLFPVKNFIKKG